MKKQIFYAAVGVSASAVIALGVWKATRSRDVPQVSDAPAAVAAQVLHPLLGPANDRVLASGRGIRSTATPAMANVIGASAKPAGAVASRLR